LNGVISSKLNSIPILKLVLVFPSSPLPKPVLRSAIAVLESGICVTPISIGFFSAGFVLERLANAICGDEEFGQTGLIQQVNSHSRYIENDKTFKNKIIGGITAITTAWGLIIGAVLKFWND